MTSGAILTAAGSGTRLGLGIPKALVQLGDAPLIAHAAVGLAQAGCLAEIVITVPAADGPRFERHFPERYVPGTDLPVTLVAGGATRQASVAAGLAALSDDVDVVLVHDAARCLTPPALVRAVEHAVRSGHHAVIPGLPVTDTIKETVPGDDEARRVSATLERSALRAVQTPQAFDRDLLSHAHAAAADRAAEEITAAADDATLVELLGETVWVVPGDPRALKITTPIDLAVAELLLSRSSAS